MGPEIEPSSPSRSSLGPLALLGILVSVFGVFAWLKVKPVDAETEEKYPGKNAPHEEKPLSPILASELKSPQPNAHKNEPKHKGRKVHPFLKFGVNFLTLVAVVWYAAEARKQRITVDKTFHQTEEQTEAALASIVTKQFRITWPEQRAFISVILDNRGRVVASDISADFKLVEISLPDRRAIADFPNWKFDYPQILPSPDLPIEKGTYLNVSQEELTGHQGMPRAIKMTGDFTYFNGFSVVSYPVCNYILGAVEFRDKSGNIRQSSGTSVVTCDSLTPQIAWYLGTQKTIAKH